MCGSSQPAGTAEPTTGGWRINGRWPFASSCMHADWMAGFCVVTANGKPVRRRARAAAGSWLRAAGAVTGRSRIPGMRPGSRAPAAITSHYGTRSFLKPISSISRPACPACRARSIRRFRQLLPLVHGAFSVGMAEGTLDELVALAQYGSATISGGHADARVRDIPVSSSAGFAADLRAAQALLQAQVASHWHHALAGTLNDEALLIEGTQAAIWISHHLHARGGCVLHACRRQRGLRDFTAAAALARPPCRQPACRLRSNDNMSACGKLLLAQSA